MKKLMYIKKSAFRGKTYLSIVEGYRINGKVRHKTIEKLGYLEELEKIYDDPIAHFKEIAKQRTKENINEYTIKNLKSKIIDNSSCSKNLGYVTLKKIYNELDLEKFFSEKNKKLKITYDLNKIFSLLVYSRIMFPSSKKETFEKRNRFFESFDGFELEDVYRSLDFFNQYKEEIETLLWNNTKDTYSRNTDNLYYDCTNYYFEINYNDVDLVDEEGNIIEKGYRKRGPEKNHRPDPIIEMGLLMDSTNLPLSFDLFPGNESEKLSLLPITHRTKINCNLGKTVIVADRGLNTSDNIYHLAGKNHKQSLNGYIYGQSIRGADEEFKKWVLDQEGYIKEEVIAEDGKPETFRQMIFKNNEFKGYEKKKVIFKHKSRIYPKEIKVSSEKSHKKKTKVTTDQKQMVYFSQKYADKQKRDRNMMIERAKDLIAHPQKYNKVTASGSVAYINNIKFDKTTGAIADGLNLSLKLDKIAEEEKYDGYYSIVTSELNMSDKELRDKYRGLSKIEETFKITKSELDARPVLVWTKEHIESHFLTCFVALVITRLLEKKLDNKYSIHQIIESLKNYNSIPIEHDICMQNYTDEIIDELKNTFSIDFSRKFLTLSEIKKIFY
jgi:transposase